MPLTPAEMDSKMDAHFQFEIRDDVEGVLTTLAADVEHDIVGTPTGPVHGREAARAFYEGLFTDLADGEITNLRRYHGENVLVDESLWRGRAVGRPFGMEGGNRQVEFRLLHVMEFTEAGEIARENVWLDFPALIRQLSQG